MSSEKDFQGRVWSYVNRLSMIEKQDKIVVGVSGGADSVCLVLVLQEAVEKLDCQLEVAHLNHGIRDREADRDALYVEEFCKVRKIPFHLKKVNTLQVAKEQGLTVEEAGRSLRYEFFTEVAEKTDANKIAVAHNKNDNAETILLNLMRGTGLKGLTGIPPVRDNVIRPLLCVEREEIEAFLQEKDISFCMDSTNLGEDYTRNRIRHNLLPYMTEHFNGSVVDAMNRAGENLRQVAEFLEEQVKAAENLYVKEISDGCRVEILAEAFGKLPKAVLSEILANGFEKVAGSRKDFAEKHRDMLFALADGESGKSVNLPYGVVAGQEYGKIILEKTSGFLERGDFCMEVPLENGRIDLGRGNYLEITVEDRDVCQKDETFSENKYTKWFDYDIIKSTLQIRNRQTGDYIAVTKDGGTRKIKDFFINEKIPRRYRDEILLLTSGSEVLWVIGYRMSEAYKITGHTKKVLKVRYGGKTYGTENQCDDI